MADLFHNKGRGRQSSAIDHAALATGVQDPPGRAIYCVSDGTITFRAKEGGDALAYAMAAKEWLPIEIYQVTTIASGSFRKWI